MLIALWSFLSVFRPMSGNHILIVNDNQGAENASIFVVRITSDSKTVLFEGSVRLGEEPGAIGILDCDKAFLDGKIELRDVASSTTWMTEFLPHGRYGQTAVVSLNDTQNRKSLKSKELKCTFNFLTLPVTSIEQ